MMITIASGAFAFTASATDFIIFELVVRRSSRLIPGLRGKPAVIITRSEPAMSL